MELGDLNLLIGENNTGKTFFATVLHRVLEAKPEPKYRLDRIGRTTEVPEEVQELIYGLLDDPRRRLNGDPRSSLAHQATKRWSGQQVSQQTSWKRYASNVRDRVEYAFGAQASDLRRRTQKGNADDSYLRIRWFTT